MSEMAVKIERGLNDQVICSEKMTLKLIDAFSKRFYLLLLTRQTDFVMRRCMVTHAWCRRRNRNDVSVCLTSGSRQGDPMSTLYSAKHSWINITGK
jgi:hypothetical protein